MITVSIADLRRHSAYNLNERIVAIRAHLGRDVPEDEQIPLLVWTEFPWVGDDGAQHDQHNVGDLLWALRCCWGRGGRAIGIEVACRAAERVMQRSRPEAMPVLRECVGAARAVISDQSQEAITRCEAAAEAATWAASRDATWAAAEAAARDARDAARGAAWASVTAPWVAAWAVTETARATARATGAARASVTAPGVAGVADRVSELEAQRRDLIELLGVSSPGQTQGTIAHKAD